MKKIYIVPNAITSMNMFCGFYSVIEATRGNITLAAWMIIAAQIFDMLDGRIARLAKATSSFGVEYDSLSDVISFGFAPAFLMYYASLQGFGRLGWICAFLFLVCGALRLARFNVMAEDIEVNSSGVFQGMPIPLAAGLVASFFIFNQDTELVSAEYSPYFIFIFCICLSILMVSSIPFSSFKELNWKSRVTFGYFFIAILIMVFVVIRPEVTIFLVFLIFTLLSLVLSLWTRVKNKSFINLEKAE